MHLEVLSSEMDKNAAALALRCDLGCFRRLSLNVVDHTYKLQGIEPFNKRVGIDMRVVIYNLLCPTSYHARIDTRWKCHDLTLSTVVR